MKARHIGIVLISAVLFLAGRFFFQKDTGPKEILIESRPSGALLNINGKEMGKTPYILRQPAIGKYWLRFSKEGFEPLDRIIEVSMQSPPEISFKFPNQNGLVLFETTPPLVEVSVNGVYKGKTPLLVTDLPYGTHRASFSLQGYAFQEMELSIEDRIPKLCQVNMRSLISMPSVESVPFRPGVPLERVDEIRSPVP